MRRLLLCFLILPFIFSKTPLLSAKPSKAHNNNAFLPWNLNTFHHIGPDDGTNSGVLPASLEEVFNQNENKEKSIKSIELEEPSIKKEQEKMASLRSSINSEIHENNARRKIDKEIETGLTTSFIKAIEKSSDSNSLRSKEAILGSLYQNSENGTFGEKVDFEKKNNQIVYKAISGKGNLLDNVDSQAAGSKHSLESQEVSNMDEFIQKNEDQNKDIIKNKENNLLIKNKPQKSVVFSEKQEMQKKTESMPSKKVLKDVNSGTQVDDSSKGKMILKIKEKQNEKDISEDPSLISSNTFKDENIEALKLFHKLVSVTVVIAIVFVFYISLRMSSNYQRTLKKREYTDEERQALNISI